MKTIIGAFLGLILLFALLMLAVFQMWGPNGLVVVLVGGIASLLLLRFLAGRLLRKAFEAPFAAKGSVLKNAAAEVHRVTPASAPAEMPEDERDEGSEGNGADEPSDPALPRVWYQVELTITPSPSPGPFQLWEPGDLVLVGPHARSGSDQDDDDENDAFEIREISVWDQEDWEEDEGGKYPGAQKLRLLISAPPGVRRARLRYYFEVFGTLDLPEAA